MSFMEILQKAREEAKASLNKNTEEVSVKQEEETNINTPVLEEKLTDVKIEALGDAIVRQSREAVLKYKKLKTGTNSSRRIAKALDKNFITHHQLQKAFGIQERYNHKRPDWHIVGSYALDKLKHLLNSGIDLNTALNTTYEEEKWVN